MRFPGFIGPSYVSQSVNVDCQRCVNLFPEINALGTGKEREVAALVPSPGLRLLLTLPKSPVRGIWRASNGTLFAAAAEKFYSISSSWVATEIGSLNTATGPVSIADNGQHVVLVDGVYGYAWTIASSTFAQIVDPEFQSADQVTFQDGYFIFNRAGSGQFFISDLYSLSMDALDFASAEGSPDNVVGVITCNQSLYVFGSQSTEVFFNSGDVFPFARVQGAVLDIGCSAPFSIAKLEGSVYWLGGDSSGSGIIYQSKGYQAARISTPAIESVIRGLTTTQIAGAKAYTYQQGGHLFYALNIPGTFSTWVFDASTGFWHERAYLNKWSLERHRADCHAVAYGLNVVGDYETGAIYALDPAAYTDNGTSIARIRTAPHVTQGLTNVRHNRFELDMETGVGTSGTGQGSDPKVMLRWSEDGGHSWSNEYWVNAGKIGKTRTRVIWRRLGSARDRVYEVRITDPVKVVLIGAELDVEGGTA